MEGMDSDMSRHCSQCGYYKREPEKRIKELQGMDNVKKEEESDVEKEIEELVVEVEKKNQMTLRNMIKKLIREKEL